MAYGRKLSLTSNSTSNGTAAQPPEAVTLEADFVVVLASLLCAIVCVLGIIVVARCAWMRRGTGGWRFGVGNQLANKGLKKKVLNSLPKYTHKSTAEMVVVEVEDCAICLAEYVDGDEIRVLPHCGHRFHVQCIDTWLGSHSSCPSCRQILAGPRCRNCGEIPAVSSAGDGGHDFGKVRPFSSAASTSALIFLP